MTIDHARELLRDSASILDTAYEVGLSGPGRLHDLFVTHEGMSPGIYKAKGKGLTIRYGFHDCPFGTRPGDGRPIRAFAASPSPMPARSRQRLADMTSRWPEADYVEDKAATAPYAARIFEPGNWHPDQPLARRLHRHRISRSASGKHCCAFRWAGPSTYSDIAAPSGQAPGGARRRHGGRQQSDFLRRSLPSRDGKSGGLCGYHWGLTRKRAILGWEAGVAARAA